MLFCATSPPQIGGALIGILNKENHIVKSKSGGSRILI
jgi:hypothetical protein